MILRIYDKIYWKMDWFGLYEFVSEMTKSKLNNLTQGLPCHLPMTLNLFKWLFKFLICNSRITVLIKVSIFYFITRWQIFEFQGSNWSCLQNYLRQVKLSEKTVSWSMCVTDRSCTMEHFSYIPRSTYIAWSCINISAYLQLIKSWSYITNLVVISSLFIWSQSQIPTSSKVTSKWLLGLIC